MNKDTLLEEVKSISGAQGAIIISKDGLTVSNSMPSDIDPNLLSAVISSMFTNIDVQSKRMQRGSIKRFSIETEKEMVVITQFDLDGEALLLLGQFDINVNLKEVINKFKTI